MPNLNSIPEGQTFSPRQVRILKMSIAIMSVLIILGIVALIFGMVRQATRIGSTAPSSITTPSLQPYHIPLDLGVGEISSVTANQDQAVLYWKGSQQDTVIAFDVKNGRELGRIDIKKQR